MMAEIILSQNRQKDACDHYAPSLRDSGCSGCIVGCANPTLKRGANNHCAYGAGDRLLSLLQRLKSCPFKAMPTPPGLEVSIA